MLILTVATVFTLPEVRVLAQAVAELESGAEFSAVIAGLQTIDEEFPVVRLEDLDVGDLGPLLEADGFEDAVARLRPSVLRRALRGRQDPVVLLDPHVVLWRPLAPVVQALRRRPVVVAPMLLEPLPVDGQRPDANDLARQGEIDTSLVAVRPETSAVEAVEWWLERELRGESGALAGFATAFSDRVEVLRDPGCNVSAWNLHARPLERADGVVVADEVPVTFLTMRGFRADKPHWLSSEATRVRVPGNPILSEICEHRAAALLDAGWRPPRSEEHSRERLPDGTLYGDLLRRMHRRALAAGIDIVDLEEPESLDRFYRWLRQPTPTLDTPCVTRLVHEIWTSRADLREAFPLPERAAELIRWAWEWAPSEIGVPVSLLPKVEDPPPAASMCVEALGYFDGHLGLGKAARDYLGALHAAGVSVRSRSIRITAADAAGNVTVRDEEQPFVHGAAAGEPAASIIFLNPDELSAFVTTHGPVVPEDRYCIGVWGWEVDVVPERWEAAFALVDEVWTYSTYTAAVLSRVSPVPVLPIPIPVCVPDAAGAAVPAEVPEGFVFLFTFDFFSTIQRKNPLGVIEAFKRAFGTGAGPTLVLKSLYADERPAAADEVRAAIGDRPDIVLLDRSLPAAEQAALLTRADCFVSLHRSEGWGLGLAESMALGKPVVATRFSGNLDFMDGDTAYLVDYDLCPVGPDVEIYPADARWAEPDLDHAASQLQAVFGDQERAREVGERARRRVLEQLDRAVVGDQMRNRLLRATARRTTEPENEDADLATLRQALTLPLSPVPGSGRRLRRDEVVARVGELRARVDRAVTGLVDALAATRGAVRAEQEVSQRSRAAVAVLERRLHEAEERLRTAERVARDSAADLSGLRESMEGLRGLAPELRRLSDASRAIPYADGDQVTFTHPVVGRVSGFSGHRDIDHADAYRRFEDVFRGPRERVRELHVCYLELIREHAPVLELGCGRGEFLELLADHRIEARGVDPDPGMLTIARQVPTISVERDDAVSALRKLGDGTVGTVFCAQVIEHVPHAELHELLRLAHAKLREGGLFVAETVNPHAAHAMKVFWTDLTHQHPVFPEVALELCRIAGFSGGFIFHPTGTGDVEVDQFRESAYAVVATR